MNSNSYHELFKQYLIAAQQEYLNKPKPVNKDQKKQPKVIDLLITIYQQNKLLHASKNKRSKLKPLINNKDALIKPKNYGVSSPKYTEVLLTERNILINYLNSTFFKAAFISSEASDEHLYLNI